MPFKKLPQDEVARQRNVRVSDVNHNKICGVYGTLAEGIRALASTIGYNEEVDKYEQLDKSLKSLNN